MKKEFAWAALAITFAATGLLGGLVVLGEAIAIACDLMITDISFAADILEFLRQSRLWVLLVVFGVIYLLGVFILLKAALRKK